MKQRVTNFYLLIFFALFIIPSVVHADIVLLLHGYLSSSQEWHRSGIVGQLGTVGWDDAGVLETVDNRVQSSEQDLFYTRRLYSVELPSEKPIDKQAKQLDHYVKYVRHKHADEQIILVGHSAGGIVARLYMVQKPQSDLTALVTIASPHQGAKNAKLAQVVS